MLTVPDGSAESFDEHVAWIACNVEHPASQWTGARNRAASMGIKVVPWIRLAHIKLGDTFEHLKAKMSLLVATANAWGSDTILPNYEDEAGTFAPRDVAAYLFGDLDWSGNTGWSTLAWLMNDVDYSSLCKDPVILQIFPADAGWSPPEVPQKMGDCVYHARAKGFTYVGVTYQTYAGATPSWYDCASCQHSTYPGNLIAHGEWDAWYQ